MDMDTGSTVMIVAAVAGLIFSPLVACFLCFCLYKFRKTERRERRPVETELKRLQDVSRPLPQPARSPVRPVSPYDLEAQLAEPGPPASRPLLHSQVSISEPFFTNGRLA